MTRMTSVTQVTQPAVVVGVDTHQQTHYAVVLGVDGRFLGGAEFPASEAGYRQLVDWAAGFGLLDRFGVESTGSYGAGLVRYLLLQQLDVLEVRRPDPATRARDGKSDRIDAEAAARAVLAGRVTGAPKVTTGVVESIRALLITRRSAVKARTAAYSQLRDLITTAPSELRDPLLSMTTAQRVRTAAAFRPDPARIAEPLQAVKTALRSLARRIQDLDDEITQLERQLDHLVAQTVPTLLAAPNVGTITAAQLTVTAGENLDRLRSEAAFAKLTGVAPIPASSGKSRRMRLNRGGDRHANHALYVITIGRLATDPRTKAYVARRKDDRLSKRDIIRCLKRAIAREVYHALRADLLSA